MGNSGRKWGYMSDNCITVALDGSIERLGVETAALLHENCEGVVMTGDKYRPIALCSCRCHG